MIGSSALVSSPRKRISAKRRLIAVHLTPTRRFAPTSPFQAEVEEA